MDLVNRRSSERKVKRNLGTSNRWLHIVFWSSSRGYPENVLGTSRINLPRKFLGRQIRTSRGRHFGTSSGCQIRTSLGRPWDSQIRPLREVLGMLEGDVFRTSWGPIFAGWEASASELIIIKSYTEVGRGRRSKLFPPTHIDYQRCTLVKGLF